MTVRQFILATLLLINKLKLEKRDIKKAAIGNLYSMATIQNTVRHV